MSLGSTSGANKIVRGSMDFRLFGETTVMGNAHNGNYANHNTHIMEITPIHTAHIMETV